MDEHIRIGGEHATIHNHTTYSFGIDDQEFMTAFECDEPADFMHLMLTLRESEASRYTERDTPIFVGQLMDIRAALDRLDGVARASRPSRVPLTGRRPVRGIDASPSAPDGAPRRRRRTEPLDTQSFEKGINMAAVPSEGHAAAAPFRLNRRKAKQRVCSTSATSARSCRSASTSSATARRPRTRRRSPS